MKQMNDDQEFEFRFSEKAFANAMLLKYQLTEEQIIREQDHYKQNISS